MYFFIKLYMGDFTQGGEWLLKLDFFVLRQNWFLSHLPVYFAKTFCANRLIPLGGAPIFFVQEVYLLNFAKTVSELCFQFFFETLSVIGKTQFQQNSPLSPVPLKLTGSFKTNCIIFKIVLYIVYCLIQTP